MYRHLLVYLVQECAANEARPYKPDSKRQCGQVEAAMHSAQSPHRVLLVNKNCDVVLAAALCNGPAGACTS